MENPKQAPLGAPNRRNFLQGGAAVGAAALTSPIAFLQTKAMAAGNDLCGTRGDSPYGPLFPAKDLATGLELIMLPEGFQYITFSWNGDRMSDGNLVPPRHDGMAVVRTGRLGRRNVYTLIRNHELFFNGPEAPIAPDFNYDPQAGGGTTVLRWVAGALLDHRVSVSGTIANCAGGPTPWGTWVTCEEQIETVDGINHGYPFESLASRVTNPTPLLEMGRFKHEALAFDARTGFVYETEDNSGRDESDPSSRTRGNSGLYRFIPNNPFGGEGSLAEGGKLAMLQAKSLLTGQSVTDLRNPSCFASYSVEWVPIDDPNAEPVGSLSGPYIEGRSKGATRFQRLEGCWWDPVRELIVFVDTEAGAIGAQPGRNDRAEGAVWVYDPRRNRLTNVFVSQGAFAPASYGADNPDNITVSSTGAYLMCEDGGRDDGNGLSLLGLKPNGQTFEFARNIMNISGADAPALVAAGHDPDVIGTGDFSGQEWAGATFSPDNRILFVNIQTPGITFAIFGPFGRPLFQG